MDKLRKKISKFYWGLRRTMLKNFVPEFVWPRYVQLDNCRVKLRHTPYSFGTKLILRSGQYEVSERQLLRGVLTANDAVLELGGSIGVLTAIIAGNLSQSGQIVSVEASEHITKYSRTWLERCGNVRIVTGIAFPVLRLNTPIQVNSLDESGGSLGGKVDFDSTPGASHGVSFEYSGTVYDLGTLMETFNITPTLLVIDIEGSEEILLREKPFFPPSIKTILIELHPHMYGEEVKKGIIEVIKQEGFHNEADISNVYLFKKQ